MHSIYITEHKTYSHIEEGYCKTLAFYRGESTQTPKIGQKNFNRFHKKNYVLQHNANLTSYEVHMPCEYHGPEIFKHYRHNYAHLSYWITHPKIEDFFSMGLFEELKLSYIQYHKKPYITLGLGWLLKKPIYELQNLDVDSAQVLLEYYHRNAPLKILPFLKDIREYHSGIYRHLIPTCEVFDTVLLTKNPHHELIKTLEYIKRYFIGQRLSVSEIHANEGMHRSITSLLNLGIVELRQLLHKSIKNPSILEPYHEAFQKIMLHDELRALFKTHYAQVFNKMLDVMHVHPWGQIFLSHYHVTPEMYQGWHMLSSTVHDSISMEMFHEFLDSLGQKSEEIGLLL